MSLMLNKQHFGDLHFQWLVKRSVETREEMGDIVRSYAISQFHKLCPLREEQNILAQQEDILKNIRVIKVSQIFN